MVPVYRIQAQWMVQGFDCGSIPERNMSHQVAESHKQVVSLLLKVGAEFQLKKFELWQFNEKGRVEGSTLMQLFFGGGVATSADVRSIRSGDQQTLLLVKTDSGSKAYGLLHDRRTGTVQKCTVRLSYDRSAIEGERFTLGESGRTGGSRTDLPSLSPWSQYRQLADGQNWRAVRSYGSNPSIPGQPHRTFDEVQFENKSKDALPPELAEWLDAAPLEEDWKILQERVKGLFS